MALPPRRPGRLVGRIFRGSDAVAAGLLTKRDLRSSAWRRLFQGVYADSRLTVDHRLRCVAAQRFVSPPSGVLAGATAASLLGGLPARLHDDVVLLVPTPDRFAAGRGVRVHLDDVGSEDVRVIAGGLRVTSPERTCWDVARWADVIEAVVIIDSLLARGVTTIALLRDYALARAGERGWRKLTRACGLADAGAESPPESRTRVRLVLAGVPRPSTQHVITHNGAFVARVDMAWPEQKVAVEYDGAWHDSPGQFERDRARLNQLVAEGWTVLHLTAKRARDDFDAFTVELKKVLRSRSASMAIGPGHRRGVSR